MYRREAEIASLENWIERPSKSLHIDVEAPAQLNNFSIYRHLMLQNNFFLDWL